MIPGTLDITLRQGDTYALTLTLSNAIVSFSSTTAGTPLDLTGCSAQMGFRVQPASPLVYKLNSIHATVNGGSLVLGGTAGTIVVHIPPADSVSMKNGVYDLRVKFPSGDIYTYVAGSFNVSPQVTPWTT